MLMLMQYLIEHSSLAIEKFINIFVGFAIEYDHFLASCGVF